MKSTSTSTFLLFIALAWSFTTYSQCPQPADNFQNFNQYDLTPATQGSGGTVTNYTTWGNDYHKVDVVAGETYEISTCNSGPYVPGDVNGWGGVYPIGHPSGLGGQGGYNVGWDPQMTLINNGNGNIVGFNDNFCGVFPAITYTSTFTGELFIYIDSATVCNQYEVDSIAVSVTWLFGCSNTSGSFSESACGSYTVPSGDETYTTSGIYMDTIPNATGCDSVMTINVTINPNATATDILTACDSYVWRDGNTYTSSNTTATHVVPGVAAAGCDSVYTLNLTINNSNTGTDTQVACDTYTWIDGNTYTSSNNTATFTETNAAGCDSIVTLDLTINNSNTGTDTQVACDTYTWIDGNTYTASNNTATFTETNAAGCDSIVTLDLTINNSNTGTDTQVACDTYTWIDGNTYTSSNNTATFTETNAAGCDSIVTLDLTINNSNTGTDTQVACDTYTWIDGNTYTASNNTATFTETNAAGCDSIVTLDLTINSSNTGTDTQVACDTYTWIDGNTYTASNNTATFIETNAAGCDSIVTLDLTINSSNTGTDTQVACDTYTWIDGNTYTASNNTATFTETNAAGCDSIVTLDLTINNSNTGTDTQVACDTYTWIDGNTYTASNNTATFTETNAAGCDSIVTLDLTINNSNTGTDTQVACDTYTWIDGNTYTASNNTATFTETNAAGCDSIVTLDLTINNSNTGTDTQVACDTYTWIDGNTYTASNNTATFTETNAAGCDSIVTLDLTINNSNTGTDTQVACDTYTWIDGNTYTSSNNTATFTETNAAGCDSVVTLNLTINNSNTGVDTQVACDSFTWIDGNTYTSSNNTATFTETNAAGCDSIVTLDLTVNSSNTGTDTQVACDTYTWIDGNTYTASNNTATFTEMNAAGCDSIVTLDLTIEQNTIDISTSLTGITISANQTGAIYQWIDCSDTSEIAGETSDTFVATANGDYAVIITDGACSDTSDCVTVDKVEIGEIHLDGFVSIYPNPTGGTFSLTTNVKNAFVSILAIDGKIIAENISISQDTQVINILNGREKGVYLVKVKSGAFESTHRLILE